MANGTGCGTFPTEGDEWMDGWMDRRMDGQTDGQTDRWTDRQEKCLRTARVWSKDAEGAPRREHGTDSRSRVKPHVVIVQVGRPW